MGRKSKLTDEQWQEVLRRKLRGETYRALAKEFGVGEATIRGGISAHAREIKGAAEQMVSVSRKVESMPISAQAEVITLAQFLRQGEQYLASAGMRGARVAERLNTVAERQMEKVDLDNPGNHKDEISMAVGCLKGADMGGQLMLKLIAAGIGEEASDEQRRPINLNILRHNAPS